MAKRKRVVLHVVPCEGGWQVERERKGRAPQVLSKSLRRFGETKLLAIAFAREYARVSRPSQVVVHGRDGRIQTESTYGNDPRKSKG